MSYSPIFTPDYEGIDAIHEFKYDNNPNNDPSNYNDGKTIDTKNGVIYKYNGSSRTLNIFKTNYDIDLTDQCYIYSSKQDDKAIELVADNGGIKITAASDKDIVQTAANQIFNLDNVSGVLSIKDNEHHDLMTIDKTGASIKVPFTAEQGMDNQINEDTITIGLDTTSAGNRTIRMIKQDPNVQTNATDFVKQSNEITVSNANDFSVNDYILVNGTTYNDGIYKISNIDTQSNIITVDATINDLEQDETPSSDILTKITFETIIYDNTNDYFKFSNDINIPDNANIGIDSDTDLLQLKYGELDINGNLVIDNNANIGIDSNTDLLQLSSGKLYINGNLVIDDNANIGIDSNLDLLQLSSGKLYINGNLVIDDNANIGIDSNLDLLQLSSGKLYINGSLVINDNANIGIDSDPYLLQLKSGELDINGKLTLGGDLILPNNANIGVSSVPDLLQLKTTGLNINRDAIISGDTYISGVAIIAGTADISGLLTLGDNLILPNDANIGNTSNGNLLQLKSSELYINGNLVIDNDANIGIDSDTDLLQLSSGELYINGNLVLNNTDGVIVETTNLIKGITSSSTENIDLFGFTNNGVVFLDTKILVKDGTSNEAIYHIEGIYTYNGSNISIVGDTNLINITESDNNWDASYNISSPTKIQVKINSISGSEYIIINKYSFL